MKIAVLNFSGNVGKTTIAKNLLLPRLADTPYLAIETINDDGANSDDIKVKGKDYSVVQEELLMNDNLIVDIGSSNVEQALTSIAKLNGSHNDYDYFLLPTVASLKEQIDTNATMLDLLELGVSNDKIRLVFNKVEEAEKLTQFEKVIKQAEMLKIRVPTIGIQDNEVYSQLRELEISMQDLLAIDNLQEKIKQEIDKEKKRKIVKLKVVQSLAQTAHANLDEVFADLALQESEV